MVRDYSAAERYALAEIARKEFWARKQREAREEEMFGKKFIRAC